MALFAVIFLFIACFKLAALPLFNNPLIFFSQLLQGSGSLLTIRVPSLEPDVDDGYQIRLNLNATNFDKLFAPIPVPVEYPLDHISIVLLLLQYSFHQLVIFSFANI